MVKVGAHTLGSHNKKAADAFEMCIAAYHMEHDFETLCLWVSNKFRPIMLAAASVFDSFRQREASSSKSLIKRDSRNVRPKMANVAFYTKLQKPRKHKTLAQYDLKQKKQQRLLRQHCSRTPGTPRTRPPATPLPKIFTPPRPINHEALPPVQHASVAKMKTIIDLTLDSDSEDDEGVTGSTDDTLTPKSHLTTPAQSLYVLRQFVRTHHRAPPSKSSCGPSSWSPMAKPIPIPMHNRLNRVTGTLTNPITIDESDDDWEDIL